MSKKKMTPEEEFWKEHSIWGSPGYLINRYADVSEVKDMTKSKSKAIMELKSLVKSCSSDKDRLAVYKAYRCIGKDCDGNTDDRIVLWISMGLNGPGSQRDYLAAVTKLVDTNRVHIFDSCIDSADDFADILVSVRKM